MTDITPPPELVHQWHREACKDPYHGGTFFMSKTLAHIAARAAQYGADQELEACCEWVAVDSITAATELRAWRRPKLPSLKEQSLALIDLIQGNKKAWDIRDLDVVRRALEQLDD